MQEIGDFHLPRALLGQAALLAIFLLIVWAFVREAARVLIRIALVVAVLVAVPLLAGWLDETVVGQWLERIGDWLLTALEAVVRWLARAWERVQGVTTSA
jgi:hypothetical protein